MFLFKNFFSINAIAALVLCGIITFSPVICDIFNRWDGVFSVLLISTICAIILLIQIWQKSTSRTPVKFTTMDMGFTLYIAYGILRLNIFKETFDPVILCEWIGLTAIYIVTRQAKPKSVTYFLYALLAGGTLQALIGLCQFAGIITSNNTTFKITGNFTNPGPLGGFLALSTVICLATWKEEKYKWEGPHLLLPCILLVSTVTLFLSDSRAAWLAVLCSACFLFMKKHFLHHHWHVKLITVLLAASLVASLYYYKKTSADTRLLTWNSSSLMFRDKPLLGHGIGSFPANNMLYQAQFLNEHPGEKWGFIADNNIIAFNEFIRLTCEQGLIGLLLFLGLFISAFTGSKQTKHERTAQACLVALSTFSFFSYPASIYPIKICFPLLLGILGTRNKTVLQFSPCATTSILLTLGTGASIFLNIQTYLIYRKAYMALEKQEFHETNIFTDMAHDKHFLYQLSEQLLQHEKINEALDVKKQLYTLAPTSSLSCDIGMIHLYRHEPDAAEYYFHVAHQMTPNHILPVYGLFLVAKTLHDEELCSKWSKVILSMPARVINSATLKAKKEAQEYLYSQPTQNKNIPN